jgi:hypothetical protein
MRYDNLSTVVLKRKPEIQYNPRFLEFCRHYNLEIRLCNPGAGNEKGRVERVIRDIKDFLRVTPCETIAELNKQTALWRQERNNRVHRTTERPPLEMLKEEKLIALPQIHYQPRRSVFVVVGKTGFVSFETNRYSVPSSPESTLELLAYPEHIELHYQGKKIATHKRSFLRSQKIENPLHRERLLSVTPNFKYQRIYQLMSSMDPSVRQFISAAEEDGQEPVGIAYDLFKLMRQVSKGMLLSAIRDANAGGICRIKHLIHILNLPHKTKDNPVYPQNQRLLDITYEGRDLSEYDKLK